MFKLGGAYSFIDCGGVLVDCPLCLAEGHIKTLEQLKKDIAQSNNGEKKKAGRPKKELSNGDEEKASA